MSTFCILIPLVAVSTHAGKKKKPNGPKWEECSRILTENKGQKCGVSLMDDIERRCRPTPYLTGHMDWRRPTCDPAANTLNQYAGGTLGRLDIAQICAGGGGVSHPTERVQAARNNALSVEVMQRLLDTDPDLAWGNVPRDTGCCTTPPMMLAIKYVRDDVIETMLDHPSSPEYIKDEESALPEYLRNALQNQDVPDLLKHFREGRIHQHWSLEYPVEPDHTRDGLVRMIKQERDSHGEYTEGDGLYVTQGRTDCQLLLEQWSAEQDAIRQDLLEQVLDYKCRIPTSAAATMARGLLLNEKYADDLTEIPEVD